MTAVRRLVVIQLGALGLVLAGLAPWVADVSGYDLARAVGEVGGEVDGLPAAWLGHAWYLLPGLGFIAWLGLYVPRRPVAGLHLVLGIVAVLFCLAFVVAAVRAGVSLGWGVALAVVSSVLLVVGSRLPSAGPPRPF